MELSYLFFLSSGLFLGWSLGANDAANIFGTAVGSKMVRFGSIATVAAICVVLGAVFGGEGTSNTLSELGSIDALAGSFMVALSAALAVYLILRTGISVSTSQAIIGAIVGWNIYAGRNTNYDTLLQIVLTWIFCPLISGLIAVALYLCLKKIIKCSHMHILTQDELTRLGLIAVAAVGGYALGANNIANVVGVFVKSSPFQPLHFGNFLTLSSEQVLFLLGSIAIAIGIFTYSKKAIMTVGNNMMHISPAVALVVVIAQTIVLLMFSSVSFRNLLVSLSLPSIPLVPISSTQSVIGAILGIGLIKGGRGINWNLVGKVVMGWIAAPLLAFIICFISLFFLANVFNQTVYQPL